MRRRLWILGIALAGLISGCGMGDQTLAQVDPDAIPAMVSYEQDVKPRMSYYCLGCHNPDAQIGTSAGWDFSNYKLVRAAYQSIVEAAIERKDMPPGGARKMSPRDQAILERWFAGGFIRLIDSSGNPVFE